MIAPILRLSKVRVASEYVTALVLSYASGIDCLPLLMIVRSAKGTDRSDHGAIRRHFIAIDPRLEDRWPA